MNKQEFRDYLKQANVEACYLSKMRGDADVISTLLSLIYTLMIYQAEHELEKEDNSNDKCIL